MPSLLTIWTIWPTGPFGPFGQLTRRDTVCPSRLIAILLSFCNTSFMIRFRINFVSRAVNASVNVPLTLFKLCMALCYTTKMLHLQLLV